jgi:hypothetical protein
MITTCATFKYLPTLSLPLARRQQCRPRSAWIANPSSEHYAANFLLIRETAGNWPDYGISFAAKHLEECGAVSA